MSGSFDPLPIVVRDPQAIDNRNGRPPVIDRLVGAEGATSYRIVCVDAIWRVQFLHYKASVAQTVGGCDLPIGTHLVIPSFLGASGRVPCNRLMMVIQLHAHGTRSHIYDLPRAVGEPDGDRGSLMIEVVLAG